MHSLVTSTFLYACESWTLTAELQRIQAMEMMFYRKILRISYKDHVTNEEVNCQDPTGNRTSRTPDHGKETQTAVVWSCLPLIRSGWNHLAQAQRKGEDKAERGRGGKTTSVNGQAWSSASPRGQWRTEKNGENCCKIISGAPTTLAVKGLMMMMICIYI